MPREEPKEISVAERPLQLDTENEDRTRQNIEVGERQETSRAQVVELPLEETEASQPKALTDACPLMEGSSEEVDMQDQEDSTRITASSPPPRGQGGARKRKPLQDRQPSKLIVRPSEQGEEKVGNRPGPSAKGLLEKLGEKARNVMRTSPLSDRTQKRSSQPKRQRRDKTQASQSTALVPVQPQLWREQGSQAKRCQERQRWPTESEEARANRRI